MENLVAQASRLCVMEVRGAPPKRILPRTIRLFLSLVVVKRVCFAQRP